MKYIKPLCSLAFAIGLTYLFNHPLGMVPALGKFFSPFEGFWQNSELPIAPPFLDLQIEGLKGEVTVQYDENHVPHIFAENDEDLYLVQGYVTAKDRLWQMEFYTLAAAGRLSEVVGERALELDRYNRRIGMANTAKKISNELLKNPTATLVMESYTAGVNAYIKQMKDAKMPVEYKILGYRPEPWSSYKTILMLQNMRSVLNGGSDDYKVSNAFNKYGKAVIDDLFPNYPTNETPIIPAGTKYDFKPIPVPAIPAEVGGIQNPSPVEGTKPDIGSNNWAVGGSKSATGLPILSNDPHLQLTLPSIWYQVQLITPTMNVYGVALPGTPGVTIGFNENIAWGVTNVGSDVMDFYKIKFKDKQKTAYFHDGKWKPTQMIIEEFVVKGRKESLKDTVYYTHHGPVVYNEGQRPFSADKTPVGHAMRWIAHETSGEDLLTFYYLNRAKNHADYRQALTHYTAPAQNFIFASNENDIAISPNGKFPLKWKGQGKYLLDGTNPTHDWQGWVPANQNPHVKNPARGFVSSANQFSTDPSYPYYLGWKFAPAERAIRINERLTKMQKATVDSLRSLQNDNFNVKARRILPDLLKILGQDSIKKMNPAYVALSNWDLKNEANSVAASIFETWVKELRRAIWEDDFATKDENKPMMYPSDDRTYNLMKQNPTSKWFDDVTTKTKVETLKDAVNSSFSAALDTLIKTKGPLNPLTWRWANVKSTDIMHLGRIPGMGKMDIENGGGGTIVNATTDKTGPSWRMIVELAKDGKVKGYGLYPGGQSGNPGSPYYDNMINKWAKGELNELVYLKKKDEKNTKIVQTMRVVKQ